MARVPFRLAPMLATLVDSPFTKPNWIFEEKYDGVRMLAYKEGPKVALVSRNGIDRTERYPKIAEAIGKLKADTLVLDGEIVIFDADKVSRFQFLQKGDGRPVFAVFDCIYRDGKDLRKAPLSERRTALEQTVKRSASLILSARLDADGVKAFEIAKKRGFEGLIAKDLSSKYVSGRSPAWLKVKVRKEDEFVIGGFTEPSGARHFFGALLLGIYTRGKLDYVGKVGTGFDEETLKSLYKRFGPLKRTNSSFASDVREKDATFVAPKLVAQIGYTEWTGDGKLRHPVYLGLRDDKDAKDVTRQERR
jgi:bifunctional non-homologous end joining protein LigD